MLIADHARGVVGAPGVLDTQFWTMILGVALGLWGFWLMFSSPWQLWRISTHESVREMYAGKDPAGVMSLGSRGLNPPNASALHPNLFGAEVRDAVATEDSEKRSLQNCSEALHPKAVFGLLGCFPLETSDTFPK